MKVKLKVYWAGKAGFGYTVSGKRKRFLVLGGRALKELGNCLVNLVNYDLGQGSRD